MVVWWGEGSTMGLYEAPRRYRDEGGGEGVVRTRRQMAQWNRGGWGGGREEDSGVKYSWQRLQHQQR